MQKPEHPNKQQHRPVTLMLLDMPNPRQTVRPQKNNHKHAINPDQHLHTQTTLIYTSNKIINITSFKFINNTQFVDIEYQSK